MAALIEAAVAAAEIVAAVEGAVELGQDAYNAVMSAYEKLSDLLTPSKLHYEPFVQYQYARSLTYLRPSTFERLLLAAQNINFSLYYEREFARALISATTRDASALFFKDGIFKENETAVIVSRPPFLDPLNRLSQSLSLTRHPTEVELTENRVAYFRAIRDMLKLMSDSRNLVDKQKFEFEFSLMVKD